MMNNGIKVIVRRPSAARTAVVETMGVTAVVRAADGRRTVSIAM